MAPELFLSLSVEDLVERYREGTVVLARTKDTGEELRVWIPTWSVAQGDHIEGVFRKGKRYLYPVSERAYRVYPGGASAVERELGQAIYNAVPAIGYRRALNLAKRPDAFDYLLGKSDLASLFGPLEHYQLKEARAELKARRWYLEALKALMDLGFTPLEAASALEELGEPAVDLARQDPFLLCQVPGVDYLALASRFKRLSPVGAFLQEIKERSYATGDTMVPLPDLPLPRDQLERGLEGAKGQVTLFKDHVGFSRVVDLEAFVWENALEPSGLPPLPPPEGLAPEQAKVVEVLQRRVGVLTGGPGTGKTYTVSRLVQAALKAGIPVQMMAPTGKAAQRMRELSGLPAQTVHRALGFRPHEPLALPKALPPGLTVLDEASMITLPDLDRVLRALPANSALLMVGDADQLPPVGLGQPFVDLVGRVPTVRLKVTRRQAKGATGILEAARCALEGLPLRAVLAKRPPDLLYRRVESPEEATRLVAELVTYYLKQGLSLWEFQVLTPIHAGPLGTRALNQLVRSIAPKERSRPLELSGGIVAYVGDKIIFDENKPLLGVMNGTMGIVRVVGDDTFLLDTGEDLKELPKGVATQASLGYAITVHRSQGSEWPAVILVLPESPLTTRKVVYTALTRAKQQAVLLSVPDLENRPLPKDRRRRTYLSLVAPAEGGEEE